MANGKVHLIHTPVPFIRTRKMTSTYPGDFANPNTQYVSRETTTSKPIL